MNKAITLIIFSSLAGAAALMGAIGLTLMAMDNEDDGRRR